MLLGQHPRVKVHSGRGRGLRTALQSKSGPGRRLRWLEHRPVHQRVLRGRSQGGAYGRQPIDVPLTSMFLFPPPRSQIKWTHILGGRVRKQELKSRWAEMAKETHPHLMSETLRRGQLLSPSLNPTPEKGRSRLHAGPSPASRCPPCRLGRVPRAPLDTDSVRKGTPSLIKFE